MTHEYAEWILIILSHKLLINIYDTCIDIRVNDGNYGGLGVFFPGYGRE